MTDKIIIDGVDVARCCCYKNGKCLWTKRYYESDVVPDCEKIKDCYYKQLKRLEQERDELKKTVENQKLEYEELQCDYNELEQRHNDAFEQFKEMRTRHDELLASCEQLDQEAAEIINELKQENKELKKQLSSTKCYLCGEGFLTPEGTELYEEKERYRSALEEIRDLCIHYENTNDKCVINCYAHFIVTDLIQNKINEVLQ